MRVEIKYDPMPEHGGGHVLYIVDRQVIAAAHKGEHATALHECLRSAGRTSVADILAGGFMRFLLIWLRGHDYMYGVIAHMRRDHHLTADVADFQNLLRGREWGALPPPRARWCGRR